MNLTIQPNYFPKMADFKAEQNKNIKNYYLIYSANSGFNNDSVSFKGNEKVRYWEDPQTPKGFGKIAGNNVIKETLNDFFIKRLAAERFGIKVQMPNGILFYGPQSTGKTTFARALAEQAKCNFREIDMMKPTANILSDIRDAAYESKKLYENSGDKKRTILLIDDVDSIANESDNFVPRMKDFLQKCSDEFKCTVVMTSNNPLNIDSILIATHRVPLKIFLGPPEKEDAAEIFKFYLKEATDQAIDHNKLADEVLKAKSSGQAFSPVRIKNIVHDCHSSAGSVGKKVSENDLIKMIKQRGPDISKASMEKFAKEIAEITKRFI